jgi:hypothetical protein
LRAAHWFRLATFSKKFKAAGNFHFFSQVDHRISIFFNNNKTPIIRTNLWTQGPGCHGTHGTNKPKIQRPSQLF